MRMRAECACGKALEVEGKVYHHVEDQIAEFYVRHEDCVQHEATPSGVVTLDHTANQQLESIVVELQNVNEHLLAIRQKLGRQI